MRWIWWTPFPSQLNRSTVLAADRYVLLPMNGILEMRKTHTHTPNERSKRRSREDKHTQKALNGASAQWEYGRKMQKRNEKENHTSYVYECVCVRVLLVGLVDRATGKQLFVCTIIKYSTVDCLNVNTRILSNIVAFSVSRIPLEYKN